MSQYELCKICKEVKANPLHVNKQHSMTWNEYKRLVANPEFLKELEVQRSLREKKAEEDEQKNRILLYNWFPRTSTMMTIIERYRNHAKSNKVVFHDSVYDLSEFEGKTEAIVGTVELAEAMIKHGWECVTAKGGHDGTPKQYIMRKVE